MDLGDLPICVISAPMTQDEYLDRMRDMAADITEQWAAQFPAEWFTGTTIDNAILHISPKHVVELVWSILVNLQSEEHGGRITGWD